VPLLPPLPDDDAVVAPGTFCGVRVVLGQKALYQLVASDLSPLGHWSPLALAAALLPEERARSFAGATLSASPRSLLIFTAQGTLLRVTAPECPAP
jgi:hypothetical protein